MENNIHLSRSAATEGAVLLKNENAVLPFAPRTKLALFGKAQIDYVQGGGGSGEVNSVYIRNIYEGLKLKNGKVEVYEPLADFYRTYVKEQFALGKETGLLEEAEVPNELLTTASEYTDTAVIAINRFSREGSDRRNDGTDTYFYLSEAEQRLVGLVTAHFKKVVVLLNVGAMMDMSWFAQNPSISAAIILWQGGMEGGLAAADLLVGDANPSGKLVDTCAKAFEDYPSSSGFHESEDYVKYEEDIYVGYRYFETIPGKKERVIYPFGYGLSYTEFSLSAVDVSRNGDMVKLAVLVTNVGNRAGKEVVQLYCEAPSQRIDKPARVLVAFAKTQELAPGEGQELKLYFDMKDIASFDDEGRILKNAYVLEKGVYKLYVGTDVRQAKEVRSDISLTEDQVVRMLNSYCGPERLEKRLRADGTYEIIKGTVVKRKEFSCVYRCDSMQQEKYTLDMVAQGTVNLDTFIAQLSDEELVHLLGGQPCTGVANTCGMGNLPEYGIPAIMTADGPAGVRLEKHLNIPTTAFPVATALACTWNEALIEEIGKAGAREAREHNLLIWLTPALNIHRSPLCGRNFEYFSEDPLISGKMAAAMVCGIQSENIVATAKHLACNNKETNRKDSDSIVSERALREIYLKGFEICVKEAKPRAIMTSYNLINGVRASENTELIQGILRGEWEFDGMVTSDWETYASHSKEAQAGNDIKMPEGNSELLFADLKNGTLDRNELCICVKHLLEMILWLKIV